MTDDWRPGYATVLARRGVPNPKVRFYLHWVERFRASVPPGGTPRDALPRFLDLLGREREPWQVEQAKEAVQLYLHARAEPPALPRPPASSPAWDALLGEAVRLLRLKHLSLRTERSYLGWLRRFQAFTGAPPPEALTSADVERFLSHIAVDGRVAATTQNQAFSALLFLYRHVLDKDLADLGSVVRARERRRLPVVLTRDEVGHVLDHSRGRSR